MNFAMLRLWLALFLSVPLFGREELVVHLQKQERAIPLCLASIECRDNSFSNSYLKELERVIRYDFSHNGKTAMTASDKSCGQLKMEILHKNARLELIQGEMRKVIDNIALTGHLEEDRVTLHRLHDALFQELFHTSGIASTRILYTVRQKKGEDSTEWQSEVWAADYDGSRAQRLTYEESLCVTPAFIPANQGKQCNHFVYVCYKMGQPKIYVSSITQKSGRRLTYLSGNQLMPALSPKLNQIAFVCDAGGNPDLFVQDFSLEKGAYGKPRQIFSAPGAAQGSPSYSPDGKQLAFVSNKDGTPRIYLFAIPPAGASVKELKPFMISKKARENTSPAWSPDGKKIAYSAQVSGIRQIWLYELESGLELQLTEGEGHKENPSWAPDSLHLVYDCTLAGSSELYMIDTLQKNAVRITSGTGEKRFPCWEAWY